MLNGMLVIKNVVKLQHHHQKTISTNIMHVITKNCKILTIVKTNLYNAAFKIHSIVFISLISELLVVLYLARWHP